MSLLSLKNAWTTTHNEYNQFNTCRTKFEEEGCELCAYSLAMYIISDETDKIFSDIFLIDTFYTDTFLTDTFTDIFET